MAIRASFTEFVFFLVAVPNLLVFSVPAQYISVVGSHVSDVSGAALVNGTICFRPTDDLDSAVKVWAKDTASTTPVVEPFCSAISGGVITTFKVPDPTTTVPANLLYRVTITNSNSGAVATYPFVKVTGPTFSWDNYQSSHSSSLQFRAYQFGSGVISRCATTSQSCSTNGPEVWGANVTGSQPETPKPAPTGTVFTDEYCSSPGTYDQSCLVNAIAHSTDAFHVVFGPHTYNFTSAVKLRHVKDLSIEGSGPATVIRRDGIALECLECSHLRIENLSFQTVTSPLVVSPKELPTPSPFTPIVIDRWGTGDGYMPTINDQDIVSTADGGSCMGPACLSHMQVTERFGTGLFFQKSDELEVVGLSGTHYSINFYDCSNVHVHNNFVSGGSSFGGIEFWLAGSGNHDVVISNNVVTYSAFSGILLGGGDHFTVLDNVVMYNGESGIKTYQGNPRQNSFATIIGNRSIRNWYDGFDLTSNNPRTSEFEAYSVASQNYAAQNHGTGYISDGRFWTFTDNDASDNNLSGMALAFCNSIITGNRAAGNNAALELRGMHQISVSGDVKCGENLVLNNRTDTMGHPGNGIYAGGKGSSLISNAEATGTDLIGPSNLSLSNTDSAGPLPTAQWNTPLPSAGQ